MQIRDAVPGDAAAACETMRRSIAELCTSDPRNDPDILACWLANKKRGIFQAPDARTASVYPMWKQLPPAG